MVSFLTAGHMILSDMYCVPKASFLLDAFTYNIMAVKTIIRDLLLEKGTSGERVVQSILSQLRPTCFLQMYVVMRMLVLVYRHKHTASL